MTLNFRTPLVGVLLLLFPLGLAAQPLGRASLPFGSPFAGGVPTGTATSVPLQLSIQDAIQRALDHNLGVLLAEERTTAAGGARTQALAELLPNVRAAVSELRQTVNFAAFGFPLSPEFPSFVGPFNVFDARVFVSQAVVDLGAWNETRAASHELAAARHDYRDARDLVVLVAANLYLQTLAADARAQSTSAQVATAEALYRQAQDLRQSGMVPGLDVVRAEVRLSTERQRATEAQNEWQKVKLQLARVIGLPLGQPIVLTQQLPDAPLPEMNVDAALERAYRERPDYQAALERVRAAESARRAVKGDLLPSVRVAGDFGPIGLTVDTARTTFRVAGIVDVPVFEGGKTQGRLVEADAELRSRRAEAEDARADVYYDVQTTLLDLKAASEELQTATRGRELADQQLVQSRDRFGAGVASNIEVIQSQEAVALASEQYISALFRFNVAKAMLARALGAGEDLVKEYLGGTTVP